MIPNSKLRQIIYPLFSFTLLCSICSYIDFEFQYPIASDLNISKIFILTYQPLSCYIFASLDLWSSLAVKTLDSHSITESTGSTAVLPAHSVVFSTSSLPLCLTVSVVSRPLCLPNFDVPTQTFVFKSIQNYSVPLFGEGGHRPDVISMYNPCNNVSAEDSQW